MDEWTIGVPRKAVLATVLLSVSACAVQQGQPGDSIEWRTGSRTGNPLEIRLMVHGSDLKAVLVNRSSSPQEILYNAYLQTSALELASPTGRSPKPYDSRLIMKYDRTPYCRLFKTLAPHKEMALEIIRFRKSHDGFSGQWGPFHFDEVPDGDYQARVSWHSERSQCLDESTRQMRDLSSTWKGLVRSNQVLLHLP